MQPNCLSRSLNHSQNPKTLTLEHSLSMAEIMRAGVLLTQMKIFKALSQINSCEVVVGPAVGEGGLLDRFVVGMGCSGLMV